MIRNLKKDQKKKKKDLLTNVDMLLMVEKVITGGIYQAIY